MHIWTFIEALNNGFEWWLDIFKLSIYDLKFRKTQKHTIRKKNIIDKYSENNITVEACLRILFNDNFKKYVYKQETFISDMCNNNLYLFAVACGNLKAVKYLIDIGFDINYMNKDGYNAYAVAIMFGRINLMKFIKKRNIDLQYKAINRENYYDVRFLAAQYGSLESLKYLQRNGYSMNIMDDGETLYTVAIRYAQIHLLKWLEENGCDKYYYYIGTHGVVNACTIAQDSLDIYANGDDFDSYYIKTQKYNGPSNICIICYNNDKVGSSDEYAYLMISCKNNHPFHYRCQIKCDIVTKCLLCADIVLI